MPYATPGIHHMTAIGGDPQVDAIAAVLTYVQQHLDEPLSLDQLARLAGYSPFHFARLFKGHMGVSPLHYVSALRLQRAKQLLLQTNLRVRDIGLEVGYQSLGTFTTRFRQVVGVTPAALRESAPQAGQHLQSLKRLSQWRVPARPLQHHARVEGVIDSVVPFAGVVLIGLFARPIPEGRPLYGTILPSLGPFRLTGVGPGIYYLKATSLTWDMRAVDVLLPNTTLRAGKREPIVVQAGAPVPFQHITLQPPRAGDPPILVSLPLLMHNFLSGMRQHSNR